MELIVRGRRISTPQGEKTAAIHVKDGKIEAVIPPERIPPGVQMIDAGDLLVMPGLFDSHVHINEPGRTEWEGFETATRAAAAGGISAVADMPLNSIPVTTTLKALEAKLAAAAGKLAVDCAFWGGVVPGNAGELEPMIDAGVSGFKVFLCPSGIDDFPNVTEADLKPAMAVLARRGVPLLVHAELADGAPSGGDPCRFATYLASRPRDWENRAVELMLRLCRETGCRVHIVHLSSSDALEPLARAKEDGLPVTAETCPHYLTFDAERVPDRRTEYKCAPPVREAGNRERLWQGLEDGVIDFVVSDHSPCAPELKLPEAGDFLRAWGGISSVQFALPAVWTEAEARGFGPEDVELWMCERPAVLAGFKGVKGRIAAGYDADLVVWDPDEGFEVRSETVLHRHKVTPYLGRELKGVVKQTLVRGAIAYDKGEFPAQPAGRPLLRKHERLQTTR